ncbi:MAG: TonB-dependent receptor [Balneolales bacterium]|nr:TonB-dependent receptor [Balneolales bacterium]
MSVKYNTKNKAVFRSLIIAAIALLTGFTSVWAQTTGTLSGVVRDADAGDVLTGANVTVVGQTIGVAAGINGEYSLSLPAGTYQIRASFLGYTSSRQTVTILAGEVTVVDFQLRADLIGADEVVVLGTRTSDRTVLESPVPIDVISGVEIQQSGYTQTAQIIQLLVPSFNTAHSSVTDGTDHMRPATLRGLGPDQVLVLVNGKRRHTGALVHVNGSIGRGSTGVDLNAIPANMIERIEVLRDGAAAQYGSDAISGVINIILKKSPGLDASVTYGQHYSTVDRGYDLGEQLHLNADGSPASDVATFAGNKESVTYTDGESVNLHLGYGLDLRRGNFYVAGQFRDRQRTSRAGLDFVDAPAGGVDRWRYGGGDLTDVSLFFNGDYAVSDNAEAYVFGGFSTREGNSAGFYRRPNAGNNIPNFYPDGFLPNIESSILDFSVAGGVRGTIGDWSYDISETFGANYFDFSVVNSGNVSLVDPDATNPEIQTSFDVGDIRFTQSTTNADFLKVYDVGTATPLSVAVGAEFRWEQFEQIAGEESSYILGPFPGAAGAQVFPGFTPSDNKVESRTNFGLYLDLENNITSRLLIGAATRYENYSDFGSTLTGKFSGRYEVNREFALRGAFSTGFRAPSLAQNHFSKIATVFIDGTPFEVGTFPVSSNIAQALGAEELKAEESVNLSGGFTFNTGNFSLTADLYRIYIDDRIVLTENFTGGGIPDFLESRGINANGGRYFTNAVNTKTTGIDVIARYGFQLDNGDRIRLTVAGNYNTTEITNKDEIDTPVELAAVTNTPLFGRVEQGRFEVGQPRSKVNTAVNYTRGGFDALLKLNRFGEVTTQSGISPLRDQTFSAKTLTDIELSYRFLDSYRVAFGANNVFDVYPDKQWQLNSNNGLFPYSGFSPFGFEGRYVYTRISVRL